MLIFDNFKNFKGINCLTPGRTKVLILSCSSGGGHIKAAQSLCLASRQFNELKIYHIDVLKHMSKFFRKVYADSYINIVSKSPNLYRHLYDMTDHDKDTKVIMNHMRYFLENLFTLFLRNQLKKIKPDCIVFTHFLPAEHFKRTRAKDKYAKTYAVVITDYDVHWLWVQKHIDLFFVATEEMAIKLISRGIKKEKTYVTGIPIEPAFSKSYSKLQIKKNLGLKENLKTILFMSGAYGVGKINVLIDHLMNNIYTGNDKTCTI